VPVGVDEAYGLMLLCEAMPWILIQEVRGHERYMEAAVQTRVYDGNWYIVLVEM